MVQPHDDLVKQVRHVDFTKKLKHTQRRSTVGSPRKSHPAGRETVEGPYEASMSKLSITHQTVLVSTTVLKSSVTRGQAQASPDQLHSDIFRGSKDSE